MEKLEKILNKIVPILLVIFPFIDALTAVQVKNNIGFISIGGVIRGLFLLIVILYLYKKKVSKKIIFMFILYFLFQTSYFFMYTENSIFAEITNIFEIFYLPFLIHFFNKYENKKIDDKFIVILYLIYLNLVIIPYIFGIGYNMSEIYANKSGYFGLFYSGNEISAIILGLLPIVLNYVINSKSYILKFIVYLELVITTLLIGTKTLFIGVILVCLIFFIRFMLTSFKTLKKKVKISIISILIIITALIVIFLPKTPVYKNVKEQLIFYEIDSVDDLFKLDTIDKVVFSSRLTFLGDVNDEYVKEDIYGVIYGIGRDKILQIKDVEIDLFDIFYSVGIFGFAIWLIMIISAVKNHKLRNQYKFSFILFILMSLFSGHVLIKPMVSIFIATLFILNKNSLKIEKKKILLVSNMYPSDKYKHYGTFVKNTKELLEENDYVVDISVMHKQDTKLKKLFSYVYLYSKTILKGIFNNYDYIYVHFISHSSLGAVILKRTSKNVELVLNAHGNDVVKDYDFEEKNIKKSKKYLKYADKVVVPSKYYQNVMINNYNIDKNKIYIYPSGGVNTDKFKKLDMDECKKNCGLKKEFNYIGFASRIDKNKGWDVFLKAIKLLEKENKINNKKFIIIGSGAEEEKMHELIKELDILKYLEIRNMVSQDELVNIYNSLDIFVFPTYRESESLGLVGLEAMACETFVIASNNFGPTDYVIDKKNGLFFNPKDEEDLKNKILAYEKLSKKELDKIRNNARETGIKYDVRNTKNKILKVFK